MFGNKEAGLIETLLRSRASPEPTKSKHIPHKDEAWLRETPVGLIVKREMYFAVSPIFRWTQ